MNPELDFYQSNDVVVALQMGNVWYFQYLPNIRNNLRDEGQCNELILKTVLFVVISGQLLCISGL